MHFTRTINAPLEMEAKTKSWIAKLMNLAFSKMIRKAIEHDMDAVKAYCEGGSSHEIR